MSIVVFGSLNMDLVTQTARLPQPGETVLGQNFTTVPGGKGANQAVAAARLGAEVVMVGRVGNDGFGEALRQSLGAAGIETAEIATDPDHRTGTAAIAVEQSGENQIIVVPGANGAVDQTDVERLTPYLKTAQVLLLQFEIPQRAVQKAAAIAQQYNLQVIVDPAPAVDQLPDRFYPHIHLLTPNQSEASRLVGFEVKDPETAAAAAKALRQRGVNMVIVKLGAQGIVCDGPDGRFRQPAFAVDVVDTVAAGDALNGGLAVALAEGQPVQSAVTWARAVAALAVTRSGAQAAMPTRSQVEAFLRDAD
ncbi:ribokinase [Romeria aff. gracilis LEGE 07310]|uniref:Ribokinase n=1 Tax=Vasconcelosia minhoensis LEGE 07310 TaxID=915328 RepID=A0A8J7DBC0_9CYAN|nr:ribokinase [Romeria gracilis]MBE9077512.1 ribokinase [Romeria aff. gracilis LEGE 07310]